jgi:hypothetical protein
VSGEYKVMDKTLLLRAIKTKLARNKSAIVCNKNNLSQLKRSILLNNQIDEFF